MVYHRSNDIIFTMFYVLDFYILFTIDLLDGGAAHFAETVQQIKQEYVNLTSKMRLELA